ncbi:hypothetical protein PHYPSEUDO_003184 [Phytophthora pseudosyringae]|uniref:RxLR effector protein n=1 Tax=Phytophthora pseudosyringae TaxID=221518 RepID=A0A8T1VRC4_9STRA|nr:hypothetical protein PHYPSEUDO_003184 [Phytophthora pseudosyringae]
MMKKTEISPQCRSLQLNMMLVRGLSPARVLEKLEVVRMTDKNFNNFARYNAKNLDKYASKKPDLPRLQKMPSYCRSSRIGYIQLYLKEADNVIILPMLERWVGQKILPSQVKYNLHEIGVTDTTKYVEWYMRNGGDDVVMAKLQKWFNEDAPKLETIGVTDTAKYVDWYGNVLVMGMLRRWVDRGLTPPQIVSRLQQLGVPNIETYAQKYRSLWRKRQAELSRNIN